MKDKKVIILSSLFLIILLCFGINNNVYADLIAPIETPLPSGIKGDINGDGNLTVTDVSILKLILVGLKDKSSIAISSADFNNDGKLSAVDLSKLKLELVGLNNVVSNELNEITAFITNDKSNEEFVKSKSSTFDSFDSMYLTQFFEFGGYFTENEEISQDELCKLFLSNSVEKAVDGIHPAGGPVYAMYLSDIEQIVKDKFNKNLKTDFDIEKFKSQIFSYNGKELVVFHPEWSFWQRYDNYVIISCDVNDNLYSVYYEKGNETETEFGCLILKKETGKYYYVSNKLIDSNIIEVRKFVENNKLFINNLSNFNSFETLRFDNLVSSFREDENMKNINVSSEELENIYKSVGNEPAGGDIYAVSFEYIKNFIKEKFNKDIDKEWLKESAKKIEKYSTNNVTSAVYSDKYDILVYQKNGVYEGGNISIIDMETKDNNIIITLKYISETTGDSRLSKLVLASDNGKYYFVSNDVSA